MRKRGIGQNWQPTPTSIQTVLEIQKLGTWLLGVDGRRWWRLWATGRCHLCGHYRCSPWTQPVTRLGWNHIHQSQPSGKVKPPHRTPATTQSYLQNKMGRGTQHTKKPQQNWLNTGFISHVHMCLVVRMRRNNLSSNSFQGDHVGSVRSLQEPLHSPLIERFYRGNVDIWAPLDHNGAELWSIYLERSVLMGLFRAKSLLTAVKKVYRAWNHLSNMMLTLLFFYRSIPWALVWVCQQNHFKRVGRHIKNKYNNKKMAIIGNSCC